MCCFQSTSQESSLVGAQVVKDPWLRRFIDLECFVLSGMLASDTICAEMAFMFMERNKPNSTIDYPMGGSKALVDALVRGVRKNGGQVLLQAHVDEIVLEGGRAVGVRLAPSGKRPAEVQIHPLQTIAAAHCDALPHSGITYVCAVLVRSLLRGLCSGFRCAGHPGEGGSRVERHGLGYTTSATCWSSACRVGQRGRRHAGH